MAGQQLASKVPPPPPLAGNPAFNRWLLTLTSILNDKGQIPESAIPPSGVTSGGYGSTTAYPTLTVDADGRITASAEVHSLAAWPEFASTLAAQGAQALPGGLQLRWGSYSLPTGNGDALTLPIVFSTGALAAVACAKGEALAVGVDITGPNQLRFWAIEPFVKILAHALAVTVSGTTFKGDNDADLTLTPAFTPADVFWMAIGK